MLEDHALWSEYGCPIDLQDVPQKIREAHLALLAGKRRREQDEHEDAERKGRKAERQANHGRGGRMR